MDQIPTFWLLQKELLCDKMLEDFSKIWPLKCINHMV